MYVGVDGKIDGNARRVLFDHQAPKISRYRFGMEWSRNGIEHRSTNSNVVQLILTLERADSVV